MRQEAFKGVSTLAAIMLLILVSISVVLILYAWTPGSAGFAGSSVEEAGGALRVPRIDAASAGPGFLVFYVHAVGGDVKVSEVRVYAPGGQLVAVYRPSKPLSIPAGRVERVTVPLLEVQGAPPAGWVSVVIESSEGAEYRLQVYIPPTSSGQGLPALTLGLLAGRDVSCAPGDLNVDPTQIHWLYIDLATGRYTFEYLNRGNVRRASGKATLCTTVNILDLESMTREERYKLGPIVVFTNPYKASKLYTVLVRDIRGNTIYFHLEALTRDPSRVAVDALFLWEDLWWPGTTASLDNYIDHVIRFTAFVNGTVRIEIVRASGCYLHMLLYSPSGLPGFNHVPSIVAEYQDNNYRLPAGAGVVYVKSHGGWVNSSSVRRYNILWDPVRGVWIHSWPVVFEAHKP